MKPLRIQYFQHVPFEGLGYIEKWANKNNHQLFATKFYEDFTLPKITSFDWLIVMGGPMGVYDYEKFPWLNAEIEFIQQAIQADKTVIGICLGSQLVAAALGAKVYSNTIKEIGWFPLTKTKAGKQHRLLSELPDSFTSFHWHGDTFDLPNGSARLLHTKACSNQAFLYNDKILGLQFHFEVTPETLKEITTNCRHELIPQYYIQSEQEILTKTDFCKKSNDYLDSILTKLTLGK
ncbi:type 1 glutamine amidotransferase [Salegentibacter sp. LM13S]|uniref:type 1 glutamine amidotransferase n=1 Tax=Salegentibacter lacus TaxID=2873599 RepID=UPI001CC9B439|nr:type 1 glutamine amidotransferase [Salegentibacter lacus]MBZ9630446.1 type 1 glutamine amidotransferase [Salegentibacter lacus]